MSDTATRACRQLRAAASAHPRRRRVNARAGLSLMLVVVAAPPVAAEPGQLVIAPGRYDIASQMVMPHLEEMRRQTDHERRCMDGKGPEALFPVMRQRALKGCRFDYATRHEDSYRYALVCETVRVATGAVALRETPGHLDGTLDVKMGGKNMTFSQHIKAARLGACAGEAGGTD